MVSTNATLHFNNIAFINVERIALLWCFANVVNPVPPIKDGFNARLRFYADAGGVRPLGGVPNQPIFGGRHVHHG